MPNQLSDQSSLYLQQHSNQPIEWMPWSKKAFALAKKLDKPIIVSIGYSACHWCHVMSDESFEDSYIASIMNRHFVCIKVDREERPDVDQTYLEAVRMFNQSAGWPLNVFCLPDGRPFWGGTYFPKEDKGQNIVPWPQVLMRIADHFKRERGELEENANNVVSNLLHANDALSSDKNDWRNELLLHSAKAICDSHDNKEGGFSSAPKFPSPMKIDFLLSIREAQSVRLNKTIATEVDRSIETTLSKMASGGLYDHIGGGFFRYSVDEKWQIPHFEKMLYDNALLLSTYSRANHRFPTPLFGDIVSQTIDWIITNMKSEQGGYFSSVNADNEEGEGEYYLWTLPEIKKVLKEHNANSFGKAYGITKEGNFEQQKSLPRRNNNFSENEEAFNECKRILLSIRKQRPEPCRDKKQILAWNALLIRGFVDAARAFHRKDWLQNAIDLNNWMTENLLTTDFIISSISFENGKVSNLAFLDDYAYWAESLLALSSISDWINPGSSKQYVQQAEDITLTAINKFKDKKKCGFFFSEENTDIPARARKKFWYDNATSSANSSLLRIFSTLHHLTDKTVWKKEYEEAIAGYPNLSKQAPQGIGHALSAITDEAIGLCSIVCNTVHTEEILFKIAQNPYRPIFLNIEKEKMSDRITLNVGKKFSEEIKTPEEVFETIFS
jgi:uncharacterized protein YyaL (SSP411 family)